MPPQMTLADEFILRMNGNINSIYFVESEKKEKDYFECTKMIFYMKIFLSFLSSFSSGSSSCHFT